MAESVIINPGKPVVLFDSQAGAASGTLTENISNFKRIKFTWGPADRGYLLGMEVYTHNKASFSVPVNYDTQGTATSNTYITVMRVNLSGTSFSIDRAFMITVAVSATADNVVREWTAGYVFRIEGYTE